MLSKVNAINTSEKNLTATPKLNKLKTKHLTMIILLLFADFNKLTKTILMID